MRDGPLEGRPLVLLAHGAGAPMTSGFMAAAATGLSRRGHCVVRFPFPYMQRTEEDGRRRPPDRAPVLLDCWRGMLAQAARWRKGGAIVVGGKSLGGRMASRLLAEGVDVPVSAAVYLGFPLHPRGKPGTERAEHLPRVKVPQLFVQGDKDPLCDLELLKPIVKRLKGSKLVVIKGAGHDLGDPEAWLDVVDAFVRRNTMGAASA